MNHWGRELLEFKDASLRQLAEVIHNLRSDLNRTNQELSDLQEASRFGPTAGQLMEKDKTITQLEARVKRYGKALGFYANEKNWYPVNGDQKIRMVIGSLDTEGENWVGGRTARLALAEPKAEQWPDYGYGKGARA